jgi:hypothetical protein
MSGLIGKIIGFIGFIGKLFHKSKIPVKQTSGGNNSPNLHVEGNNGDINVNSPHDNTIINHIH